MQTDSKDVVGLVDLPCELILKILEYLEVKFITEVLALVSTLFRCVLICLYALSKHDFLNRVNQSNTPEVVKDQLGGGISLLIIFIF